MPGLRLVHQGGSLLGGIGPQPGQPEAAGQPGWVVGEWVGAVVGRGGSWLQVCPW